MKNKSVNLLKSCGHCVNLIAIQRFDTKAVKKSVKTGDMSDSGGAGLLALFSMTTVAGILSKRRR